MSLRPDERFQIRETSVRYDQPAGDCYRIATGMAEDETLVQNQVGFPGRSCHQIQAFAAGIRAAD